MGAAVSVLLALIARIDFLSISIMVFICNDKQKFRPFPCSNAVSIEAKKNRLVLKSRLVVGDEDGILGKFSKSF